jgi:CDGSH-type Zn-finger protein/uncharacterized Fe-S cluster protein YjdI
MTVEKHESKDGILYFDGDKCIHSRNCVLNRPDVFVPNVEGDWIHPEKADAGELAAIAEACPSGAIRFEGKNKASSNPLVNTLHVRENGPYAVGAEIKLNGEPVGSRLTLCRCGASKNKPYCDGSHNGVDFKATGEPPLVESSVLEKRDGGLNISPQPDGPLMVEGSLEICTGTGKTINRVEKTFLCRCGASKNKPYCDGTHQKIGFKSNE